MKIEVHSPDAPDITIPLPNSLLFSFTLWNGVIKIGTKKLPEVPPEVIKQVCAAIKHFRKDHEPWELVHVESADGSTVSITI